MDLAPCMDENDAPFLIDSGTESITASPLAEETVHSQNSTVCDLKTDKSFSVDEDELGTPLEPTPVGKFLDAAPISPNSVTPDDITFEEDDGIEDLNHIDVDKHMETDQETIVANNVNILKQFSNRIDINDKEDDSSAELMTYFETIEPENESDISESDEPSLPETPCTSILRKSSCFETSDEIEVELSSKQRHVYFPSAEDILVSYKEPENNDPWTINKFIPADEILKIYEESCKKHKTIELDAIKSQIQEIKNNMNHSATLKLNSIRITCEVNETLEDILKVTNFHTLILQECQFTPETMTEFLNMLEYYSSACHFEIAMNFDDDDTWLCFCTACSNIMVLESLSFKGMEISEQYTRKLINVIKNNTNITTLKFDGCMLVKLPTFYLVDALMQNTTIRELYLPSTGLYTKEADTLQRFLVNNTHLKVLDISNNNLGDRGLEVLAKGLCNQNTVGYGLSVLVIFNNQITDKSGPVIKNIIVECGNLHTLNIGFNNLTDDVLVHISEGLPLTRSLEGLGLQCTLLTCKGILALSKAIPENTSLQKINLKGNKAIQIAGVEALCDALTQSKINKIEIDENNRACNDPEAYSQLVKKLNALCTVNKNITEDSSEDEEILNISQKASRKTSLSCEPKYNGPDLTKTFQPGTSFTSPASSPATRSRFQIVKVPENGKIEPATPIKNTKSRFRVSKVVLSPDEDIFIGRFANIRSSVSSNDSVDSLTTIHMDSDSE
ncbi:uncharacterized protein LOC143197245 isoform X2 [Rhynchophorus ferrugineus]|uniref:uncharacterized protein LOC143197245 isoform X2 n=1 Tax=Rhynchophorus ferrugineus TaxID=354439 RepID=UPI003FCCE743